MYVSLSVNSEFSYFLVFDCEKKKKKSCSALAICLYKSGYMYCQKFIVLLNTKKRKSSHKVLYQYSICLWSQQQSWDVQSFQSLYYTEGIEWPEEDEWQVRDDAKDLITQLLQHNPLHRLGTTGVQEVKEHAFFEGLDWESLLRQKAEFVPALENEEDTSYFDSELKISFFFYITLLCYKFCFDITELQVKGLKNT